MPYIKVEKISPEAQEKQIAALWSRVFGDSVEYVSQFIHTCKHKTVLAVLGEGEILSMLFLIDCEVQHEKGKYIYAVCTGGTYRNRGFATALLQEAKKYTNTFLCLIPAEERLKVYYAGMGFQEKYSAGAVRKNILFSENAQITDDLFDGSHLKVITAMFYYKTTPEKQPDETGESPVKAL